MKKNLISKVLTETLGVIYPENLYCMACGDTIEAATRIHGLCDSCIAKTDWNIENPYEEVMDDFAFDSLWTCSRYGFYMRKIMNGLKLGAKTYYARSLGLLLAERVLQGCEEEGIYPEEFSMAVPVPMSPAKFAQRGYNQAELLARQVCAELDLPLNTKILYKIRETPSMRFSDGQTRRTALSGAFAVKRTEKPDVTLPLSGCRVLLVDDVSTTGSTFDACARALKDAGASQVTCLCVATVGEVKST